MIESPLLRATDTLIEARAAHDSDAFDEALEALWAAAQNAGPDELTAALAHVAPLLAVLDASMGGEFAVLCGALIEIGAMSDPLMMVLAVRLPGVLNDAVGFTDAWAREAPGVALPEPDMENFDTALDLLDARMAPDEASRLTEAWFSLISWLRCATTLLQTSPMARQFLRTDPALRSMVTELEAHREDMTWVSALLEVMDGEQLVVLHRAQRRGYRVSIGGVGDNFQLHTLLAGKLSGPAEQGLLTGYAVDPAWTAVAADAPRSAFGGPVRGQFNLVDAHGNWIWNEGTPADVPLLDGVRVVVLDPPPYERTWDNARRFPLMPAWITLDEVMGPDQAAAWLSRVAPAKQLGA
ncbi:hypothetical protein Cs7R123_24170 [Catellatospora sp. TT07R-123]|uniref:hypothetical protein n=1 Tax=Catellatospora sp. TT07R-123 TaxID=2733863 RepID=UPI001B0B1943|nr:hypothetical protein [Catellatospora sp. TT07R-123]GHJ45075.1 hypothetical protein Cs7R123_24170 [Catellatospora sp. TT07R-123]